MKEIQNWYVRRGSEIRGPFPAGLVSNYVLLGRISEQDEVSPDKQEWQPLSQVAGLIPEVLLVARTHPEDADAQERLAAARRWADERQQAKELSQESERRDQGSTGSFAKPRSPVVSAQPGGRRGLILLSAILLIILLAVFLPKSPQPAGPRCDAPPAPGVNWSNCRMEGGQYPNADLAAANLRNTNLTAAVLRAANLQGADLAYANLTLTNLRGANLKGANLKGANLRSAELASATLEEADLSYADLSAVDLQGISLQGVRLDHAIWQGGAVCLPGSLGECLLAGMD